MAHDFLKLSIRKSREFSIFARASLFIFATQTFRVPQSRVFAAPASSRGCYCIINFQRTFWFHRDKNVHQSHSSSRRRGRPSFHHSSRRMVPCLNITRCISHVECKKYRRLISIPLRLPPTVRATLTSVCETRVEFFPMTGIRCIGAFPIECRRHRDETYLTFRALCGRKRFNVAARASCRS